MRRLELIARLQDRGLSLKAIRDALCEVEQGRLSLDEWLRLSEQIRTPWCEDAPSLLSQEDLSTGAAELMREHLRRAADDLVSHITRHADVASSLSRTGRPQ